MLGFDDIKNDIPKVIDYLDREFFSDSTVTMMNDEYLKKAIRERLCQIVFKHEGLAPLNTDGHALSKAMLRSSLSPEDINFILNATLKVSDVQISIKATADEATAEDGDKKKDSEEETVENANAMIKAKMESMGSIENLIGIIRDNLGTSRIVPVPSAESAMEAMMAKMAGNPQAEPVLDMLSIERPLELNLNFVDLTKISNTQIFQFLNVLMASDSNSSLEVTLPIDAFIDPVKDFLRTDLEPVLQAAVDFAHNSAKNSISFTAAPDPYKALFETL
jgi:hypothetical protein